MFVCLSNNDFFPQRLKTGWLSKYALDQIRLMLKKKLDKMSKGELGDLDESVVREAEKKIEGSIKAAKAARK